MYAAIFEAKQTNEIGHAFYQPEGTEYLIIKNYTGAFEGIRLSLTKENDGLNDPCFETFQFESVKQAEDVVKVYKGHGRYAMPNGKFRVIKVEPEYKQVITGYREVSNE